MPCRAREAARFLARVTLGALSWRVLNFNQIFTLLPTFPSVPARAESLACHVSRFVALGRRPICSCGVQKPQPVKHVVPARKTCVAALQFVVSIGVVTPPTI